MKKFLTILISFLMFFAYPNTTFAGLNDGLVAYYPFNGNANDESGNGNHGTVYGAALTQDRFGQPNRAYHFDGQGDYIDIGNNVKPPFPITVSAWVRVDSFSEQKVIFRNDKVYSNGCCYYGIEVMYLADGRVAGMYGDGGYAGASSRKTKETDNFALSTDKWHHIVVRYNACNSIDIFVDGIERTSVWNDGRGDCMVYSTNNGTMGNQSGPMCQFDGFLDEVRVYNRGLSENEILQLYNDNAVTEFVTRFYFKCLNRPPDTTGLDGWVNGLRNGWITGADLAEGFIFSPEFISRGTTDEEFLTILYRSFFNRQPDTEGFNGWLSALQNRASRSSVLEGFVYSDEFSRLCNQYGITPYSLDLVEAFVTRFYKECLNREPDQAGLDGWANALKNGWVTGGDVAEKFIMSPEYTNLGTSDEEFLETLYYAFFNRQPDTVGFNGWLSALRNGLNRSSVLNGFITSVEFFILCSEYGIDAE